jgi:hypothetical protein
MFAGRADRYGCPHKHLGPVIYTANMANLIAPSPSTASSQPVLFLKSCNLVQFMLWAEINIYLLTYLHAYPIHVPPYLFLKNRFSILTIYFSGKQSPSQPGAP